MTGTHETAGPLAALAAEVTLDEVDRLHRLAADLRYVTVADAVATALLHRNADDELQRLFEQVEEAWSRIEGDLPFARHMAGRIGEEGFAEALDAYGRGHEEEGDALRRRAEAEGGLVAFLEARLAGADPALRSASATRAGQREQMDAGTFGATGSMLSSDALGCVGGALQLVSGAALVAYGGDPGALAGGDLVTAGVLTTAVMC
jgi:hypothetical protein